MPLLKKGIQIEPDEAFFVVYLAWAFADQGINSFEARLWLQTAKKFYHNRPYVNDSHSWF